MKQFQVVYVDLRWGEETIPAESYVLREGWFIFWVEDEAVYRIRADLVRSVRVVELVPA